MATVNGIANISLNKSLMDMINKCLLAIGEIPYPDTFDTREFQMGTDAETARRLVEDNMLGIQSQGWFFNTDYNLELVPDAISKEIIIDPNIVRLDFGITENNRYNVVRNKVYDYKNKTTQIEADKIIADAVSIVDYDELPIEAYLYIAFKSARMFQQKVIGSLETDSFTMRDEIQALSDLQRLQLQSQDYILSNQKASTRTHNGYLVSGLYGSKGRRGF